MKTKMILLKTNSKTVSKKARKIRNRVMTNSIWKALLTWTPSNKMTGEESRRRFRKRKRTLKLHSTPIYPMMKKPP